MNHYNENHFYDEKTAEVTYYPEISHHNNKNKIPEIIKVTGFIICMAAVSFSSVGIYKYAAEDKSDTGYVNSGIVITNKEPSEYKAPAGKAAVSTAVSEYKSIIELSARENALSIPEIVKKSKPSVVGVSSDFFNEGTGTGTGIIMTDDGYIVTNAHVVQNSYGGTLYRANNIKVVLSDKTEFDAEIIGADSRTDLAVLKINPDNDMLEAAEFGDSNALMEGELAVAIGNPLGFELYGSTTCGIISALNRTITIDEYEMTLIQTDAAINPGNSGGPLLNSYGQVVGINSSKIIGTHAEGLGFAIPICAAKPVIDELVKNGYVTGRPLIGIRGENINELTARYYNIPQGVYVRFIDIGSAAELCGIEVGDIIIGINGTEINSMSELNMQKDKFTSGDKITLSLYRKNTDTQFDVNLTLDESIPEYYNTVP